VDSAQKFPVLLFDGVCNLCNASVQWVLRHDRAGRFRFAALQSETGQALLARFGLDQEHFDTAVLVDGDRIFTRSDAALEILRQLGFPWSAVAVLRWAPRSLRNVVYDWVARNRYRWFGRQEKCLLPRPEWKQRFL
jgi:predicted DCC family thiol-disulfide oxidoreductase YuxK